MTAYPSFSNADDAEFLRSLSMPPYDTSVLVCVMHYFGGDYLKAATAEAIESFIFLEHQSANDVHRVPFNGVDVDLLVFLLVLLEIVITGVILESAVYLSLSQTSEHVGALGILPADQRGRGMYLEAIYTRDVSVGALGSHQRWIDLEHDVVEGCAEVGTVDGTVSRGLGVVDILAPSTIELDRLLVRDVGLAHWQEGMRMTEDAWALSEVGFLILVELRRIRMYIQVEIICICSYHLG